MVTMRQVANRANVSVATVSNVINNTGNVSAKTAARVEDAIASLGYQVNISARQLRQNVSDAVSILIPDMRQRHYIDFYKSMSKVLQTSGLKTNLHETGFLYSRESSSVEFLKSQNVRAIVAYPTYTQPATIYNRVPNKIHLTLVGPPPEGVVRPFFSVTFDYAQIASQIASHIIKFGFKNACLFVDSQRFSKDFVQIIIEILSGHRIKIKLISCPDRAIMYSALASLSYLRNSDVIITSNISRANAIRASLNLNCIQGEGPEVISLSSCDSIFDHNYNCVLLNNERLGSAAGRALVKQLNEFNGEVQKSSRLIQGAENRLADDKIVANLRCGVKTQNNLSVFISDTSLVGSIRSLAEEFCDLTSAKINWVLPAGEADSERLDEPARRGCDVAIVKLRNFNDADFFRTFLAKKSNETIWENIRASDIQKASYLPELSDVFLFGFYASTQLLFMRNEIFNKSWIKKHLSVLGQKPFKHPVSLNDLLDISATLNELSDMSSNQLVGGNFFSALGSSSFWQEFGWLLSAYSNGDEIDHSVIFNCVRICATVFRFDLFYDEMHSASFEKYIFNKSPLAIIDTSSSSALNSTSFSELIDKTYFSYMPASTSVNDLYVLGILSDSKAPELSGKFIHWITSPLVANKLTILSGMPVRKDCVSNAEVRKTYPWLELFNDSWKKGFLLTTRLSFLSDSMNKDNILEAIRCFAENPIRAKELVERVHLT